MPSALLCLISALIVCIQLHTVDSVQLPSPCRTGDNRPGRCVRLRSCASLQLASQQATDLSQLVAVFAYVRQSLCGYDDDGGGGLMVCCTDGILAAQALDTVIPIAQPPTAAAATAADNDSGLQFYEAFTFASLLPTSAAAASAGDAPVATIAPPPAVVPIEAPVTGAPSSAVVAADAVCGISNFTQTRVVGGANAKLNAYPWIGILAYQVEPNEAPKYLCASSLVSPRYVLTTAHCVRDDLLYVRLGEHDLTSDSDGANPINVQIVERKVHEEYVANLILNDIALLRLAYDVPISAQIRPICLPLAEPLRSADLTGYQPFLAGWGSTSYQGAAPAILQEAQVPIVSNEQCELNYRQLFAQQTFDGRTLCAGEGGRDACQGDSGGPLMLPRQQPADGSFYYVLIGLVSYGYECAREGFPGVYTRVSAFVPWIQGHMV